MRDTEGERGAKAREAIEDYGGEHGVGRVLRQYGSVWEMETSHDLVT